MLKAFIVNWGAVIEIFAGTGSALTGAGVKDLPADVVCEKTKVTRARCSTFHGTEASVP